MRCGCDSGAGDDVDAFLAMPLGRGRGRGARDRGGAALFPEEAVVGGDHEDRAVLFGDRRVTSDEIVDFVKIASRNSVVAIVIGWRDLRLFRRRERREDVTDRV